MLRRAIEGCGTNGAYRITGRSRVHRRRTLDGWGYGGRLVAGFRFEVPAGEP